MKSFPGTRGETPPSVRLTPATEFTQQYGLTDVPGTAMRPAFYDASAIAELSWPSSRLHARRGDRRSPRHRLGHRKPMRPQPAAHREPDGRCQAADALLRERIAGGRSPRSQTADSTGPLREVRKDVPRTVDAESPVEPAAIRSRDRTRVRVLPSGRPLSICAATRDALPALPSA
jgi:hypothetical protein